jgi:hypothetical protein
MVKAKRSLASRVNKTKVSSPSIEAQEKALLKLQEKAPLPQEKKIVEKKQKSKKIRVSVDFPGDVYEVMKTDTQKKGQTLKGFIVAMVREHYNLD